MNKKISVACSVLMGLVLTASAYAAEGDCDKMVKGNWSGRVTAIKGSCSNNPYPVGTSVRVYLDPYEVANPAQLGNDKTTCNFNWIGGASAESATPVGPQDSTITFGQDPSIKLLPSSVLVEYSGYPNSANIVFSSQYPNSVGVFGGNVIYIDQQQVANDCSLQIQLNK